MSNQRYLKPQNMQCSHSLFHHLISTCHELAAENYSICPLHNSAYQGRCQGLFCRRGTDQTATPQHLPAGPHT